MLPCDDVTQMCKYNNLGGCLKHYHYNAGSLYALGGTTAFNKLYYTGNVNSETTKPTFC